MKLRARAVLKAILDLGLIPRLFLEVANLGQNASLHLSALHYVHGEYLSFKTTHRLHSFRKSGIFKQRQYLQCFRNM